LSGRIDALFVRHLLSDAVIDPTIAYERQRFEAAARSVRDVLSRRWIDTQRTYDQQNPKRVYYLSVEFLIGRSLTNNITNLMLHPFVERAAREEGLDLMGIVEQEPDAGLGNGGLGRLAACFLDPMATMQLPAMGYGLRYEYGMFRQTIVDGWQREQPDNWLRQQDPWEVSRRSEAVEVRLGCTIEMHQGSLRIVSNRPSTLIGFRMTGRWSVSAARQSTACACGASRRTTILTSRSSARATLSARCRQHRGADPDTRALSG
jgi:glycogen phosphorylase